MTEYITKEQAWEIVKIVARHVDAHTIAQADKALATIPSADVAPVVHGEWKFVAGPNEDNNIQFMCDNCGAGDVHAAGVTVPYCWRCGARMEGDQDD